MKIGLVLCLLLSVSLLVGCAILPQPAGQPDQPLTPPALNEEINTVPAVPTAQVYQVVIENSGLLPVDVEIKAGDTIEWVNKDEVRYTLMFNGWEERLPVGGMVEYRFTESGTVRYTAVVVEEDQDDDEDRELHGTIIVN